MADQFRVADAMDVGTYGCFSLEPSSAHRLLSGVMLVGTYGHFKFLIGETVVCYPTFLSSALEYTLVVEPCGGT